MRKAKQKEALFFIYGTASRPKLEGEELEDKLLSYREDLEEETRLQGGRLFSINEARGYWQGEEEPSYKAIVLSTKADAFAICQSLRDRYEQDAIMLIEPKPEAADLLLSVNIPTETRAEEIQEAAKIPGYTITGNKIEIIGGEEEEKAAQEIAKAIKAGTVNRASGRAYFVTERSEKQKRKAERKERRREIETGEKREERRAREKREAEARGEREEREKREKQRASERAKRKAEREAKTRAALLGIAERREEEEREAFNDAVHSTLQGLDQGEAREIIKGVNIVRI